MRVVVQRVSKASVSIAGKTHAAIGNGLMVLLGIEDADTKDDVEWLSSKITELRIFNDGNGVMNESVLEKRGDILLVSQFTLHASTKKGNRPSYIRSAKSLIAVPLYEMMLKRLGELSNGIVRAGIFGADMQVELINDGPVTILIDSKHKE